MHSDPARSSDMRIQCLRTIAEALAGVSTPAEVAAIVTAEITARLGATGGVLAVLGPSRRHLELLSPPTTSYWPLSDASVQPLSAPLPIAVAARTGKTVRVPSVAVWLAEHAESAERPPSSWTDEMRVAVPLRVGDRVDGAIGLSFPLGFSFGDEEQELLEAVGALAGFAIDHARLHEREREHSERLRREARLVDLAHVFARDLAGRVTFWNTGCERLYGWTRHEAIGQVAQDLLRTQFPMPLSEIEETVLEQGFWSGELIHTRRDGAVISVASHWALDADDQGRPTAIIEVDNDITDRRAAEHALAEQHGAVEQERRRLRAVLDILPVPVLISGHDGRILEANAEAEQTWGTGLTTGGGEVPGVILARAVGCGETVLGEEMTIETAAGRRVVLAYALPIRGPRGEVAGAVGLHVDITERKQLEDELRRRAGSLAEADQAKNEFLAMLAHELRNPLGAISNTAALLRALTGDVPAAQVPVTILQRQVGNMARMVDDLLDVSRISRGKLHLQRELTDFVALVQRAVEMARPMADQADVALAATTPSGPIWLTGDPTRLEQVVSNLLNNAVKYTDPGGRIDVTLDARDSDTELRVRDTGVGILPDLLSRIFAPFTQQDQTLARSRGGLGLGLTLVKRIVEMHGGTVTAASAGAGCGSTFTVRLPLLERVERAAERVDSAPGSRVRRRVLVVDDNEDAADSLGHILEAWGHTVFVARSGPEAVEVALRVVPEIVLLDIGLPGMDGYQVAEALRADTRLGTTRLVALTGYSHPGHRERATSAGIQGQLTKPVDLARLREILAGAP